MITVSGSPVRTTSRRRSETDTMVIVAGKTSQGAPTLLLGSIHVDDDIVGIQLDLNRHALCECRKFAPG